MKHKLIKLLCTIRTTLWKLNGEAHGDGDEATFHIVDTVEPGRLCMHMHINDTETDS